MQERPQIMFVGPYRPPVGGVATHVERLTKACLSEGYKCCVLDIFNEEEEGEDTPDWVYRLGGCKWARGMKALFWLSKFNSCTVHFHIASMDRFRIAGWPLLLATHGAQTRIITIHGGTFVQKCRRKGPLFCTYMRALLRSFDAVIVVNNEQAEFLIGELELDASMVHMIPAYIRPPESDTDTAIPIEVREAVKGRRVIVGSGQPTRIYGHDLLLKAVGKLDNRDDLMVVIALYSTGDAEYLRMLDRMREGMSNCMFVYDLEPDEFNALLAETDIYVRPTYTDGDSVAVREALANGCRVVASDCIDRPDGVATFKSGCDESLRDCLQRVICSLTDTYPSAEQQHDSAQDVMAIYKNLAEDRQWP